MAKTYPAPGPAISPWLVRLPVLFVTGVILLVLVLVIFTGAVQMRFRTAVVPGVWASGVELSGLSRAEAAAALADSLPYTESAIFTFRNGERFWQYSAGELGVSLDVEATVDAALASGRSDNLLVDLFEQINIWFRGRAVAPVVCYDESAALERLLSIAAEVNQPPVDASLRVNGIFVESTPGAPGYTLDVTAMLDALRAHVLRLDTGAELPLIVAETAPRVADVSAAADLARVAVSGSVTLVAEAVDGTMMGPWTATPDQIGALLMVAPVYDDDGTMQYTVDINVDAFRTFLEGLAPGLIVAPKDARFNFDDDTRQLVMIENPVNGRELDVDETLSRLRAAIFSREPQGRTVPVVFRYTLPYLHSGITAAELGITELLAEGRSNYRGSTVNRIANIIESTRRFNGVLIGPGDEFSFNTLVGDITPEEGFAQGFIIFGGRTVEGVGGGVCQVSTTAFRAAFYAGFPILERYAHGYRVGFYENDGEGTGMDAAIYQGGPGQRSLDLRFVNDTAHYLLIEASVNEADQTVSFRFYGTNPGRQVIKEGPVLRDIVPPRPTIYQSNPNLQPGQEFWVDWPAEGAFVIVTRRILDLSGAEINREEFRTQYQPWGAVVEVAPSDPRLAS